MNTNDPTMKAAFGFPGSRCDDEAIERPEVLKVSGCVAHEVEYWEPDIIDDIYSCGTDLRIVEFGVCRNCKQVFLMSELAEDVSP